MNLELDNRVIIVSGGSRGIGAFVVSALAGEGAWSYSCCLPVQEAWRVNGCT